MADPGLAALDPIFCLHHAKHRPSVGGVERDPRVCEPHRSGLAGGARLLRSAWVRDAHVRRSSLVYTPQDVTSLSQLNYTYDDLSAPSQPTAPLVSRLARLGAAPAPHEEGVVMAPERLSNWSVPALRRSRWWAPSLALRCSSTWACAARCPRASPLLPRVLRRIGSISISNTCAAPRTRTCSTCIQPAGRSTTRRSSRAARGEHWAFRSA